MTSDLPTSVQMQFMRPGQLEAAARAFPVIYVLKAAGSVEIFLAASGVRDRLMVK